MNLDKVKNISYNPNSGEVMYEEDSLQFNQGDKNTAFLNLRGEMEGYIRAELKVKAPSGKIAVLTSKVVNNLKNICRQFQLIVDEPGKYECQLVLSYSNKTNTSDIFSYVVKESL